MNNSGKYLTWAVLSVVGAFALGYIALNRGEQINALWIVVASVCIYLIAYRFYGRYIAKTVLGVDGTRMTPAVRHNDGLDYVPTDKKVLFGHHFAAIAGAGPLVGPVLAAQMGYLPGMIWILAGVVLAGAVQDFMVLFVSTRRDGRSLGELVKEEMGATAGVIALVATFMIMVIILAVLAMIVVKALTHSPWGTYTVAFTIPLALFMGIYIRYLRPGRIGEVSVIGLVFLVFAIISGGWVAESPTWAPFFDFTGVQLTWMLVGYGFVAAVLPVWLLLAPRDYLSTFLKIGTIVGLAIGILIMRPTLTMPALTKFIDGTGPVWTGNLFPFLFITIACGTVDVVASAAQVVSGWGFAITPETLTHIANEVGEQSIISRAGGAPTLAVGMAYILHGALGGLMDVSFWYHFAILFEALFILTAVDAGTRAARFMLQDLLGVISPNLKRTDSLPANLLATALCVLAWGYFLHQGVVDPLGGINTLWPLFGIANQMLAGMALMLCAVVLFKMKRQRYAWVALVPTAWLLICTLTAGWQKAFSPDNKVGFLAIANKFQAMIDSGKIPAQYTESQLSQLVFNNRLDAGLTIFFMVVVVVLALYSLKTALAALKVDTPTAKETPYEPMPENLDEIVTQAKGAH
ncbi:carbon starvation protein A [Enterobacter bugandensis]|uniref:carbon starvation CstA family protein n=1 Tax=Enterobacter bugandensis TaxID=881260 RepID=UPI002019641A|nr:carbon starvation CstA family protein [Enterobacter bugandensis]UQQ31927.1 carbon starvation protein A [Enterobacter bugandensis]